MFHNATKLEKAKNYWKRTKVIQSTLMSTVDLAVRPSVTQGLQNEFRSEEGGTRWIEELAFNACFFLHANIITTFIGTTSSVGKGRFGDHIRISIPKTVFYFH